jgi:DNA-binding transcriptional ArsR family regulator
VSKTNVFFAISDPTRRAMLDLLKSKPLPAGDIVSRFSHITQPGVSRHLRVLREAQLVNVTVHSQQRVYALRAEGLRELHEWVSKYQSFWDDKLDSLEEHLKQQSFETQGKVRKR